MDILQDPFGRRIDYARLSLTDRCNLHCQYCRPALTADRQSDEASCVRDERSAPQTSLCDLLSVAQWQRLIEALAALGIRKLKLTGGEPLLYPGFTEVLRISKATSGIEQVTLTTNGLYLQSFLPLCEEVGIDGINISLDALDDGLYQQITGRSGAGQVLSAIHDSVARGLTTKVNAVIIPGVNESQILPLAALAEKLPIAVRFIEMMPLGEGGRYGRISGGEIRRRLEAVYPNWQTDTNTWGNGPATYRKAVGMQGSIGFIDPVSHAFCDRCNRIRIQSNGDLQLCLVRDQATSLRPLLTAEDPNELKQTIATAIRQKPAAHDFQNTDRQQPSKHREMWQIGG
ncbi:MAG: GTP 3',8-cyclase MoaA [Eubacteriales bacterium]|nr:GTP 3',8-cyclase MoaA [Eubacteriales bacterium]